jgi:hypothetical protein
MIEDFAVVQDVEEFPIVIERPLYTCEPFVMGGGTTLNKAPKHKAIVEEKTGRIISVVGEGYKTIQNSVAVPRHEEAIHRSRLDTTGMTRQVSNSHDGARTVVKYTFPTHKMEVVKGDIMHLQITFLNSYDGSWKLGSLLGALRLACTNGQVVHDSYSAFYGKHTKSLDIDEIVRKLERSLDVYMQNVELWKQYPSTGVSIVEAERILIQFAKNNKKMLKTLQEIHARYVLEMGNNLWALFNTFTHWSTHTKVQKESNRSSVIINREQKVRSILPQLESLRLAA